MPFFGGFSCAHEEKNADWPLLYAAGSLDYTGMPRFIAARLYISCYRYLAVAANECSGRLDDLVIPVQYRGSGIVVCTPQISVVEYQRTSVSDRCFKRDLEGT